MKKDEYYYFPTMTKNIALVRDEKMSCFDIGTIISLKKQRKNKIKKINENN